MNNWPDSANGKPCDWCSAMNSVKTHDESEERDQEELVAYLDGELDHDTLQRVEERLSTDQVYRSQLQALQRSWDLLDCLPQIDTDESFTKTTVEMVAVRTTDGIQQEMQGQRRQRASRWGLAAVAIVGAAAFGFLAVTQFLQRPERQFLQDLPVIENVDVYQYVEDIEFLRQLDREGLFSDEVDDAA